MIRPTALVVIFAIAFHAAFARADEPSTDDARAYFNRGVEFYRDGAYEAALVQFKRAYETVPNYRVLYNVAQTALRLQDFATALSAYERYLRDGGAEIAADRRASVEQEVGRLQGRVSRVTLTTNASEGEVFVDDAQVASLPLATPLVLSAGRRKITVVPRGAAPITRVVEVPGGEALTVPMEVALAVAPAPPAAAAPAGEASNHPAAQPMAADADRSPESVGVAPFVTGGVAVAAGAGAVACGLVALGAKRDADAALARFPGSREEVADAHDRMKTMSLAADILGAAALVAAGVTVYLVVDRRASGTRAPPRVDALLLPTSLRLRARF